MMISFSWSWAKENAFLQYRLHMQAQSRIHLLILSIKPGLSHPGALVTSRNSVS